jgi:hypothetical protein
VCCVFVQVEVLAGRMSGVELMLGQAEQLANAMQVREWWEFGTDSRHLSGFDRECCLASVAHCPRA